MRIRGYGYGWPSVAWRYIDTRTNWYFLCLSILSLTDWPFKWRRRSKLRHGAIRFGGARSCKTRLRFISTTPNYVFRNLAKRLAGGAGGRISKTRAEEQQSKNIPQPKKCVVLDASCFFFYDRVSEPPEEEPTGPQSMFKDNENSERLCSHYPRSCSWRPTFGTSVSLASSSGSAAVGPRRRSPPYPSFPHSTVTFLFSNF